jgi:hypothetical protein
MNSLLLLLIAPLSLQGMYFCNNPAHKDYRIFRSRYVYKATPRNQLYVFTPVIEEDLRQHRLAYIEYLKGHRDESLFTIEQLNVKEKMPGHIDE